MTKKDVPAVYRALQKAFGESKAPVVDLIAAQGARPFDILVATLLSARTKDATTAMVTREKLFPVVKSFADLRAIPLKRLEELVFPVGFFRQKAKHLKEMPDVIDREFSGEIPQTVEELCRLPGVGRKTANLVVAVAFRKPAVCVDVHVHRISNRLGIVKTRTPFETEMELRKILPEKYWRGWNAILVSFGQNRCFPRNPKCEGCPISRYCNARDGENGRA